MNTTTMSERQKSGAPIHQPMKFFVTLFVTQGKYFFFGRAPLEMTITW